VQEDKAQKAPKPDKKKVAEEAKGPEAKNGSSSSSSSSSSSDSSDNEAENAEAVASESKEEKPKLKACFSWEVERDLSKAAEGAYGLMGTGSHSVMASEVENFILQGNVGGEAAQRLRCMPAHQQRMVLERGPIGGSANPAAVLITRIRDAEMGRSPGAAFNTTGAPPVSSNPKIEQLIQKWNLDSKACLMLRLLPPDKHSMVLGLDMERARNASAFVITQMNSMFGGLTGIQELNKMHGMASGGRDATSMNVMQRKLVPLFNESAVVL